MISVIIGIILVIVAVITWVGKLSPDHATAILIGAIGVLVLLGGIIPGGYFRRS